MPQPDQLSTEAPPSGTPLRQRRILLIVVGALAIAAAVTLVRDWQRRAKPPDRGTVSQPAVAAIRAQTKSEPVDAVNAVSTDQAQAAPDGHQHTNALINETSPYLLQHARNPVNWMPWGAAALAKAKREDKPIFLSVGYSTCYWCHVMEHESFENEAVAAVLNKHFIAIKVDREERPDVDEQYMLATQLVTGRGGWPNSLWLTPDGRPWMAGTYFPREQFIPLLEQLAEVWTTQREKVESQADRLTTAIARIASGQDQVASASGAVPERGVLTQAIDGLLARFDADHGGFSSAPKFPPHGGLRLLLYEQSQHPDADRLAAITKTLDAMWLGGIHDHIGGGFHRYATDHVWLVPHFEKMLYDNAQLLRIYAEAAHLTGRLQYRQAAADIVAWLEREMISPQGAFFTALDAGEVEKEGESYLWHFNEVVQILGEDDGRFFAEIYGIDPLGNFTEEAAGTKPGTNIPHLDHSLAAIAAEQNLAPEVLEKRLVALRQRLLEHRLTWPQPHRDDKVLTAWNALMIEALAYAGRVLDEPRWTDLAARATGFILRELVDDQGHLLRSWRGGAAKQRAFLDDYAFLIAALMEVHVATGADLWLVEARRLADVMLTDFADPAGGAFFFTAKESDALLTRSRSLTGGGNVPDPNGVAAVALIRLADLTGADRYRTAAGRVLAALSPSIRENPQSLDYAVLATAQWHDTADRPTTSTADD